MTARIAAALGALMVMAVLAGAAPSRALALCPSTGCAGGGTTSGFGYVTVTKTNQNGRPLPAGAGTVSDGRGTADGIDCGTDCAGRYAWSCIDTDCSYTPANLTATPGAGWQISSWSGCDSASGATCTINAPSNPSSDPQAVSAVFRDASAPSIGFSSAPAGGTHVGASVTVTVYDSDNDGVASLTWYVDNPAGGAITGSPARTVGHTFSTSGLSEGPHTFGVQARDWSGNISSIQLTLVVDHTPPALQVLSGPANDAVLATTAATYGFSAEADSSVRCSLDSTSTWRACSGAAQDALTGLSEGSHTWRLSAIDSAGNVSVISRTFTVDTTPPALSITGGPPEGSTVEAASTTFGFSAEPGATVACSLDSESAFRACSSTSTDALGGLADGAHVWRVRATDAAGNVSVASRSFSVHVPVTGGTSGGTGGTVGTGGTGGTDGIGATGGGSPAPSIDAAVRARWRVRGSRTTVLALSVRHLPAGAKVVVACKGKGCRFRKRTFTANGRGVADLHKAFRKPLKAGDRITIAITARGYTGEHVAFKVRRGRAPKRAWARVSASPVPVRT